MKYRWTELDDTFHYLSEWEDDLCVGYVAKKKDGFLVKTFSPYRHKVITEEVFNKLFSFDEMDFKRGHALVEAISRMEGWQW